MRRTGAGHYLWVDKCAECLLGFSFRSHNHPMEWPLLLPSSDRLQRYREENGRFMAELGLRLWQPGDDPSLLDCFPSLHLASPLWSQRGSHARLYVGQIASFIKSELKTDPPFGMDNGAKICLCNSQDICWLNSSQGPKVWMPQSTQPRVQLVGITVHECVLFLSDLFQLAGIMSCFMWCISKHLCLF